MTAATLSPRFREIVATTFAMDPEEITPACNAESAPAWDSLGHLQLVLALESEYGVRFDSQDLPQLTSVAGIYTALEAMGVNL